MNELKQIEKIINSLTSILNAMKVSRLDDSAIKNVVHAVQEINMYFYHSDNFIYCKNLFCQFYYNQIGNMFAGIAFFHCWRHGTLFYIVVYHWGCKQLVVLCDAQFAEYFIHICQHLVDIKTDVWQLIVAWHSEIYYFVYIINLHNYHLHIFWFQV